MLTQFNRVKWLRLLLKIYKNVGYKGIAKTGKEIFKAQAIIMERAGTGGALFRNIYRDFLKESFELLKLDKLEQGYLN